MRLAAVVLFLSSFACAQDTQSGLTRAGLSILLIFVCALFVLWALFLTFYNTRFLGWLGSLLLRWYLRTKEKRIYLDFGSLSFNIFAAKLSFREVRSVHFVGCNSLLLMLSLSVVFRYISSLISSHYTHVGTSQKTMRLLLLTDTSYFDTGPHLIPRR